MNHSDLMILKKLGINGHPRKANKINEVIWYSPKLNWLKCNSDGSTKSSLGRAGCGGILEIPRVLPLVVSQLL